MTKETEPCQTEQQPEPSTATDYAQRAIVKVGVVDFAGAQADIETALRLDPNCAKAYAARGYLHFTCEQHELAWPDLNHAIELNPCEAAAAYDIRGLLYQRRQEYEQAVADHTMAISYDPTDVYTYLNRAGALAALQRYDEAIEDLNHSVGLLPQDTQPLLMRAQIFQNLGDFGRALADLNVLLRTVSADHAPLLARRGECHLELGADDQAIADITDALPHLPSDEWRAWAHIRRGRAYLHKHMYAEALDNFEQAVALPHAGWDGHFYRGICAQLLGNHEKAVEALSESIQRQPDAAISYVWRAKAHIELSNFDAALVDANSALAMAPNADAFLQRARCRLVRGDASKLAAEEVAAAFADLDEALRLDRGNSQVFHVRGVALYQRGDFTAALDCLDEAIRLTPLDYVSRIYRGMTLMRLGEFDVALDDYETANEINPDQAKDRQQIYAISLCESGHWEESLDEWNSLMQSKPPEGLHFHFRGKVYKELGEYELALADFDVATRLQPDDWSNFWLRGLVWDQLGQPEKALHDFDRGIELEPAKPFPYRDRAHVWEQLGRDDLADADDARADELDNNLQQDSSDSQGETAMIENKNIIYDLVKEHFNATPLDKITITERYFPFRAGPELQIALDELQAKGFETPHFHAVQQSGSPVTYITTLWTRDRRNPILPGPPHYQQIDIGEERPIRCLQDGLWLLRKGGAGFAVLLETYNNRGIHFQVAAPAGEAGEQATQCFFRHLEDTVQRGACYRGKVLSLEWREMYSGQQQGIMVHHLRQVQRDEVILPQRTLDLLDRNTVEFVQQRRRLTELGMATKKGLLFYGPPGTGKTHTIHYLARMLPDHTTFLITAEQVGILSEYLTLAHLFRPSMVVIEDVDLIARQRGDMRSSAEESMLNKLLNEMDGLREQTDVMFILTTNRPEALEEALAARPGRIDQAIEFPFPDHPGRTKLVKLYSRRLDIPEAVVQVIVERTNKVSAAFIKELMRRTAQFQIQRDGTDPVRLEDVDKALDEMLVSGGSVNRKLLGANEHDGRLGFRSSQHERAT